MIYMSACKKTEDVKMVQTGSMMYKSEQYAVRTFRFEVDSVIDNKYISKLQISSSNLRVSDDGITGYGLLLQLPISLDSTGLGYGLHIVGNGVNEFMKDSSFLYVIPKEQNDTVRTSIIGGEVFMEPSVIGVKSTFCLFLSDGDSIKGSYEGRLIKNYDADGDSIGVLNIDTLNIALQAGKIWSWGKLFSDELYYYEMEIRSKDFRYTDDGVPKNGYMLTLGFHSNDADRPRSGVYVVSTSVSDNTLYYGHKEKNVSWGTYWQLFQNKITKNRANVKSDTIEMEWLDDSVCKIRIGLRDQLNNDIKGEYNAATVLVDAYKVK